ncbi:hypothetical protein [Streptomyces sp. NPDC058086]|uniref:hypothetical protein n=1 Tax=Streptomyces sp. NPDC058086 TaxID=3346334 RepID=UPI0036E5D712
MLTDRTLVRGVRGHLRRGAPRSWARKRAWAGAPATAAQRTGFGELAWDHAREQVPGGTEEEVADAAAALLRRAHDGPAAEKGRPAKRSRRDRRVADSRRLARDYETLPATSEAMNRWSMVTRMSRRLARSRAAVRR